LSQHFMIVGPDPLDVFYALPRGRRSRVLVPLIKPYFSPVPGYQLIAKYDRKHPYVIAGKMACLVTERFLRSMGKMGVRIILRPYRYCSERIRVKAERAGGFAVEPLDQTPEPGGWLNPTLMFKLWSSLRYMACCRLGDLEGLALRVDKELSSPEVDWARASSSIAAETVSKYYEAAMLTVETFLEDPRISRVSEGRRALLVSVDTLKPLEYNILGVVVKHLANTAGKVVVAYRKGTLLDYMLMAVPSTMGLRADRLAVFLARTGVVRLKVYDSGKSLVEGLARVFVEPEVIVKAVDTRVEEVLVS